MPTAILIDGAIENGARVYATSQSGSMIYPASLEHWTGSAKLRVAGAYTGFLTMNAVIRVEKVGTYAAGINSIQPIPTDAIVTGVGNGRARFWTDSTANKRAFRLVLTRNAGQWDAVYTVDGNDSPGGPFPDTYEGGGHKWEIIAGSIPWADGDKIEVRFFQIAYKLSMDGGASYFMDERQFKADTGWTGSDFELAVASGIKLRVIMDSLLLPARVGDTVRVIAGYENGVNNLSNPSRLRRWVAADTQSHVIYIDTGKKIRLDMASLFDRSGVATFQFSTRDSVCDSCVGVIDAYLSPTVIELKHLGDWAAGLKGGLYITSGKGAGKRYGIDDSSASVVTLATGSNPMGDGVAVGDYYMIRPDTTTAPVITPLPHSDASTFFFGNYSGVRGIWVHFDTSGNRVAQASLIRIGKSIVPEIPINWIKGDETTLRPNMSETTPGDVLVRAGGYPSEVKEIEFAAMATPDRDKILSAIKQYNSVDSARGMILYPDIAHPGWRYYGMIVNDIKTETVSEHWCNLGFRLRLFPTEPVMEPAEA